MGFFDQFQQNGMVGPQMQNFQAPQFQQFSGSIPGIQSGTATQAGVAPTATALPTQQPNWAAAFQPFMQNGQIPASAPALQPGGGAFFNDALQRWRQQMSQSQTAPTQSPFGTR